MAGSEAVCWDVDLPALVVEALDKIASPGSRGQVIDAALERAQRDRLPVEVHRMLLFVTGPLLEVAAESLGAEAASGLVQDLRPVLERAFDQVLQRAGVAETIPPPSRFHSSIRDREASAAPRSATLSPPRMPQLGGGGAMVAVEAAEPARVVEGKPRSNRRGTVPYMQAVQTQGDVLIVDDEPHFRRGLTRLLGLRGYDVIAAADGPSALKLCQRIAPVLVITDWQMPGIDGAELAGLVAESMGDEAPPVVMLTGASDAPQAPPHVACVLPKHGSVDTLIDVIEPYLSR